MKTRDLIAIAIADQSVVVRSGLLAVLRRFPKMNIQAVELNSMEALDDCLRTQPIDILIVNPFFEGLFDIQAFNDDPRNKGIKVIAFSTTHIDPTLLVPYDSTLTIFDSLPKIGDTIHKLHQSENAMDDQESLTDREKEVVVCVVKGMTNKEIAEHLFLSVHTVNTHRKNISRKLQIHSPSGLTIYAIVNKLVDINEIQAD